MEQSRFENRKDEGPGLNVIPEYLKIALTVSAAVMTAAGCFCEMPALAREVEAISISQKHIFFGKMVVTASSDALRIDDKSGLGFILVTRAPEWTVNIFREKEKTIFSESFSTFSTAGLVNDLILPVRGPVSRGEAGREKQKEMMGFSIVSLSAPFIFDFLPRPNQYDKKISVALISALRTHPIDGFPINQVSIIQHDLVAGNLMKNHNQADLVTTSIAKVKVSSDIFEAPKAYAKVSSRQEVVSGPNSKEQAEDLQDFLGPDPKHK